MTQSSIPNSNACIRRTGKLAKLWRVAAMTLAAALCAAILPAQSLRPLPLRFSLSPGCGKPSLATGLAKADTKDGRGFSRSYMRLVPKTYDPHRTYSLVVLFHGSGATSEASMSWGLQDAKGAGESAIFLFPQGIGLNHQQAGWEDSAQGYDVGFFDTMVSEVEEAYCVDRDEIFVMGFSWGGDFVKVLGCSRGDKIRAMAVNSAGTEFKDSSDYRTYRGLPCPSRLHPAVRFEHAEGGDQFYPAPEFATNSKFFRYLNQCSGPSRPAHSSNPVMTCKSFDGCAADVIDCSFNPQIGHGLPPNWAQDTWDFFASFRRADRDASHYR